MGLFDFLKKNKVDINEVVAGLADQKIGLIIDALKKYERCAFPLKAVMTETSRKWAAAYAFIHIKAEHESLHPQ